MLDRSIKRRTINVEMTRLEASFRNVLLSSGSMTPEAVISSPDVVAYESSPEGLTVGSKERRRGVGGLPESFVIDNPSMTQGEFDAKVALNYDGEVSTALSLAYLRYRAQAVGVPRERLYEFLSNEFDGPVCRPRLIFNVLNGGRHAGNELDFCEFMIIPRTDVAVDAVRVASEVYHDLRSLIVGTYGEKGVLVGREGGFAPDVSNVGTAIELLVSAIGVRHEGMVDVAIDVAANDFAHENGGVFTYSIQGRDYSTNELVDYYVRLVDLYPSVTYLEDPFHEDDLDGWRALRDRMAGAIRVVADDLTVTDVAHLERCVGMYDACILKVNQIGSVSGLLAAFRFCRAHRVDSIVSQRSGETDSPILAHLAVGLGAEYMKAGAPARERILKYNELMRISS